MNKQGIGLWIVVCALLVLDIGVHCVRAQDGAANVMKVQELQILDSRGHVAIDLKAVAEKPGITLYDSQNRPRVLLTATDNGGRLNLADEYKNPQLLLDGQWAPSVTLRMNNQLRMAMQAQDYDNDDFQILDRGGKERVFLGYKSTDVFGGVSVLSLHTDDPTNRSVGMSINESAAYLGLNDASGFPRVGMDWVLTDPPRIYVTNKSWNTVWQKKAPGKEDTDGFEYLPPGLPDWKKGK
jgi:hypothetical protein